jgi:hypothetical protein
VLKEMGPLQTLSNFRVNRSAKQRRCLVPVALRAPAPGYARRWAASCAEVEDAK